MLDDTRFNAIADSYLTQLMDAIETADTQATLEVELDGSGLSILLPNGRSYVINKHAPSKQIWLSSPISGGLHFSYDEASGGWILKDGRNLDGILVSELQQQTGITFTL